MKFKVLLLVTPLLPLSVQLYASAPVDSIGVENLNGKKVVLHKLDPKDNYYSIGRRYNVSPKTIIQFNNNAKMTIGNIIKVPTDRPFTQQTAAVQKAPVVQPNKPAPAVQTPVAQAPEK